MNFISKYILLAAVLVTGLWSCEKDENKIFFEGGTNPILTASSTDALFLTRADKDKKAIKFSWTNPNYQFTTGVSSQDVNYVLQVDTVGANFTSPFIQEVSISKELSIEFTVQELNAILTKLNMAEDVPHDIEFRLKASLGNNAGALYSNVIAISITPYLDVAVPIPPTGELFITGDGTPSGWTNAPPVTQQATQISNTEYTITMNFSPGFYYKFLSTSGAWQPQYGGSSATGGDLGYNMGGGSDPDAIPTPAEAGTYKVTLNFKTGKYSVVKQ